MAVDNHPFGHAFFGRVTADITSKLCGTIEEGVEGTISRNLLIRLWLALLRLSGQHSPHDSSR